MQKKFKICTGRARHTFAITLINGMPIQAVGKLLGHSKLIISQIYARVMKRWHGEFKPQITLEFISPSTPLQ